MKRFNLSGWAVSHPALILFLVIALGAAGFFSYQRLGRAEDPFFTVKVVNVSAIWPGATAAEMQSQVADPIEKKLQELPYFEKVQTYSKPAFTAMQVTFRDSTPPKDVPYLAEQYISGRELTVGVIDQGEGPFALPPIEIQVDAGRSFDYASKYLDAGTREICPANISDALREAAEDVGLAAHTVLGCEGYSRTDMIAADDDHIYFLELNTLPGLTASSLVPKELRATLHRPTSQLPEYWIPSV